MRAIVANRIIPLIAAAVADQFTRDAVTSGAVDWFDYVRWLGAMRAQGRLFRDCPFIYKLWIEVRQRRCLKEIARKGECPLFYPDSERPAVVLRAVNFSIEAASGMPFSMSRPYVLIAYNKSRPIGHRPVRRPTGVVVVMFPLDVIELFQVARILCVNERHSEDDVQMLARKHEVDWVVTRRKLAAAVDDQFQLVGIKDAHYYRPADRSDPAKKARKV